MRTLSLITKESEILRPIIFCKDKRIQSYRRVGQHVGWCVGRHNTDTSAETLPMHQPTHYQRVGRHTTNAVANSLKSGRRVSWHSVDCPSTVMWLSTKALADVLVDVSVGSDSLPVLYLIFQVPFSPGLCMYNVNKHYFSKMKQHIAKKSQDIV